MTGIKLNIDTETLKNIKRKNPQKVDEWLRGIAQQMVGDIKLSFGTSPDGRAYKRGKVVHIASQPNYPPNVDTGTLRASIDSKRIDSYNQQIYSQVDYAIHLELGTEKMLARPFVEPVFKKWSKIIANEARWIE